MCIKYHNLQLLLILTFFTVFSQSWKEDSLVVRHILDTNGLQNVKVDDVVTKKDSSGRAKWLTIFDHPSFNIVPASIEYLEKLNQIIISKTSITTLPPEIGDLKSITVLSLSQNKLNYLPPEIGNLEEIRRISIRQNELTSLPPEIGNLKKMYSFQIQKNKITSIPDEICNVDSLISISAEYNLISYIPEDIGYMPSFQGINLDYNKLKHVPNSLIPFGLDDVRMCYNDSLVFTEEQKAAWGIKDYEDYFNRVCEAEIEEGIIKEQPRNSIISIRPCSIVLIVDNYNQVSCSVYNISGRKIETLINGVLPEGAHTIPWDRNNYSHGIYFVRYSIGNYSYSSKTVVK